MLFRKRLLLRHQAKGNAANRMHGPRCRGEGGYATPTPAPIIQYARSASDMAGTACVAAGFARFGPGTEGPNGAPPTRRVRCYATQAAPT